MKHRRVFVALSCLLVSAVAAPTAAAADSCKYTAQDLPLPAGVAKSWTSAGSPDNRLIGGEVELPRGTRGVLWENGLLKEMAAPDPLVESVYLKDITNGGVVVGRHEFRLEDNSRWYRAFWYHNGGYHYLYTEAHEESHALGINEGGDVIGEVWVKGAGDSRWIAMWPRNGEPRRLYHKGHAIGISADRKLVTTTLDTMWVIDGNNGSRKEVRGGGTHTAVLDNERVLRSFIAENNSTWITEWTVHGPQVAWYDGGVYPLGRNAGGTVFGSTGLGNASLWNGRTRTDVVADKVPYFGKYGDITDDGVLIGTYEDAQGRRAARWFCV